MSVVMLVGERGNVDPGLINPSHYWGGVPSKSGLNPHSKGTPPFISQGFIHLGLMLSFI